MDSTLPPPPLLDPGDMESERTPAQLLQWVEQKVQEFYDWHDELRRNLPSEQYYALEEEFYLDRRTKKFFEELRPLAGLVTKKWLFGRDVRVKPMLSSKNYDAVVILPEEGAFNVEITTTIRGQQAVIQREHMRKYGYYPATHDVKYRGSKKKDYSIQRAPIEAVDSTELRMIEFYRIMERFVMKSKKCYLDGAWLLIAFDDYIGFQSKNDIDELHSRVALYIVPRLKTFNKVFLIGQSGRPFLEFSAT